MTPADRPSVTDARAEAEQRYGTPRESDLLPSDYVTIGQIEGYVEGRLAAGRAETTTATTEDAVERVFQTTHPAPNTVMGWIRAGYEAGLLATARTRPTREQIREALSVWDDADAYEAADAVLALLADQPDPADVWDQGYQAGADGGYLGDALSDNPYRGGGDQ